MNQENNRCSITRKEFIEIICDIKAAFKADYINGLKPKINYIKAFNYHVDNKFKKNTKAAQHLLH